MSATIEVACPHCGRKSRAPADAVGRSGKCRCGRDFVIAESHAIECPNCRQPMQSDAKQCPACGSSPDTAPSAGPIQSDYATRDRPSDVRVNVPAHLLDDGERVLFSRSPSRRYHAIASIAAVTVPLAIVSSPLLFMPGTAMTLAIAAALGLAGVAIVAVQIWAIRFTVYAATTRRILMQSGIFSISSKSAPFGRIQDIEVKQAFIMRLFGVGHILFNTAGSSDVEFKWRGVEDPHAIARHVRQLIQD